MHCGSNEILIKAAVNFFWDSPFFQVILLNIIDTILSEKGENSYHSSEQKYWALIFLIFHFGTNKRNYSFGH